MKAVCTALAITLLASVSFAQSDARATFTQLKSLDGAWTGTNSQGQSIKITFRETSGGSAIMSEIDPQGPHNMISMIHLDNDRLLLTHYCSTGNQPRMKATASPDGKSIAFDFVDGTNIEPNAHHMERVVFNLTDANHHTETWTFLDHGKTMDQVFTLTRTETVVSKN